MALAEPLILAGYANTSETTEYPATVPTVIDKFTGTNIGAAVAVLTVKLVPQGGSAGTSNIIVKKSIDPGETVAFWEIQGHALEVGGFISVICDTASAVVRRCSGRKNS